MTGAERGAAGHRPLPRVHAVTDARVLALDDLGVRAAAIAAAGSAVALHARDRSATAAVLAAAAARLQALARPPEAALFVSGRADIAAALDAQGLQLAAGDLPPPEARSIFGGWIGRSIHTVDEAAAAADEGADYLMAGSIFPTASHPDSAAAGLGLIERVARLGLPVIAIGGVTAERAAQVRDAGAWGVAAIRALWDAADPAAAALDLLTPWTSLTAGD